MVVDLARFGRREFTSTEAGRPAATANGVVPRATTITPLWRAVGQGATGGPCFRSAAQAVGSPAMASDDGATRLAT